MQLRYYFPCSGEDIDRMHSAAQRFVGEHDFRNFCGPVNVEDDVKRRMTREMSAQTSKHADMMSCKMRCVMQPQPQPQPVWHPNSSSIQSSWWVPNGFFGWQPLGLLTHGNMGIRLHPPLFQGMWAINCRFIMWNSLLNLKWPWWQPYVMDSKIAFAFVLPYNSIDLTIMHHEKIKKTWTFFFFGGGHRENACTLGVVP